MTLADVEVEVEVEIIAPPTSTLRPNVPYRIRGGDAACVHHWKVTSTDDPRVIVTPTGRLLPAFCRKCRAHTEFRADGGTYEESTDGSWSMRVGMHDG